MRVSYIDILFTGEVPTDKFQLEMVQVTIRHGDRYTLHKLPEFNSQILSCDMEDFSHLSSTIPELENFLTVMRNNADKLPQQSSFFKFGLYPKAKECQPGHLTPNGAAQHVKNGAFFKKAYVDKWKLLNDDYQGQIKLVSTIRQRTFQSGVALLYGLVPEFDFSKLHITDALDSKMCSRTNPLYPCSCDSITRYMDVLAGTFGQTLPKFTAKKDLRKAYKQIAQALGISQKEVPRASHIMDVAIVHMCHHMKLPGSQEKCMEPSSLRTVVEAINDNGHQQAKNPVYKLVSRLRMYPLLNEMVMNIEERITTKSAARFYLYSGHDSTIDPLLTALNISDGMWPMYACRVNVELYSTKEATVPGPKRYFIRVLYNGLDVTTKVIFCRGKTRPEWSDMCPLQHFKDFTQDSNVVQDLKLTSYKQACIKPILQV